MSDAEAYNLASQALQPACGAFLWCLPVYVSHLFAPVSGLPDVVFVCLIGQ